MQVRLLSKDARIPTRGSAEAAGYDLYASDDVRIQHGSRAVVSTGIALKIPAGHYGKIESRSGLALNNGLIALAGVIDSDYRGEVKVILANISSETITILTGTRVAQIIIVPYVNPDIMLVDSLEVTQRGSGGFGSTGA